MIDIHLLSGAYALDALDPDERARFEDHVADCPDCEEEVASLREAAAALAEDRPVPPPPELRDAVLGAVRQVRPLPPRVRHRGRRRHLLPLLVAAAVLVAAGAAGVVWSTWPTDAPSATPTVAEQVLAADDAERAVVDLGDDGRATVVRSASKDRAVLVTEDMVAPPKGKVYQVWLRTPTDDMVPAGVMDRLPDQTLVLDGPAATATGVGITVEPAGGSDRPTSDPIVVVDLAG